MPMSLPKKKMSNYILLSDLEQIYELSKGTGNEIASDGTVQFVIMTDKATNKKYACSYADFVAATGSK